MRRRHLGSQVELPEIGHAFGMPRFLHLEARDVPLVIEALRAYAPQLEAESLIDHHVASVLDCEARRAGSLADNLVSRLLHATDT